MYRYHQTPIYLRSGFLSAHVKRIHEKHRPHKCELCDYSAEAPRELERHLDSLKHQRIVRGSSERKFQCTYERCNLMYTREDNLNRHIDTKHLSTGEKRKHREGPARPRPQRRHKVTLDQGNS